MDDPREQQQGVEHGSPADPPPTEEELDLEGPNESAPGHNPEDDDDAPAA